MNKCEMLHETVLRDIIDIVNSVKSAEDSEWVQRTGRVGSISRQASNLVLVFPVIVSNALNIQTATIITKAIERKCVSLLQILFASINFTDDQNLYEFISQFHSNLNAKITLDDFIAFANNMTESGMINITDEEAYNTVMEDMRNINYYLKDTFNETSINDYISKTDMYGETHILKETTNPPPTNYDINAKTNNNYGWGSNDNRTYTTTNYNNNMDKGTQKAINNFSNALVQAKNGIGLDINHNYKGNIDVRNMGGRRGPDVPSLKDQVEYFSKQLLPQDVQKANELQPTLVAVNFTSIANGTTNRTTGIIGVKAKMYPVDSMEIISRVSSKYKDSNTLFNLIRATTREISFFKDFAFAIEKAKLDAVNMAKQSNNAKIFKLLERRAAKNRFSTLVKKNDASPITSLVMSQEEVEYLRKYNNIDMDKQHVTRAILEAYNLMDIVIADESLEIAKFLFDDGDGIYDVLPFDALEKEAKDSSYKKVINLMSKINR